MNALNKLTMLATATLLSLSAAAAAQPGPPSGGPAIWPPNPGPAAGPPTGPAHPLEYAVKFVCGRSMAPAALSTLAAQGSYFTAINIHNPGRPHEFAHKIALARIGAAGPMTGFQHIGLPYDAAIDFDCNWIRTRLGQVGIAVPPLFTGFFVIQSRWELDVVAVYSAAPPNTNQVATMHTERVPVRRVIP